MIRPQIIQVLFILFLFVCSCSKKSADGDSNGQLPETNEYLDQVYGNNKNWQGVDEALKMDVYLPDEAVNSRRKFPFVMFVHGGGFLGGDKSSGASYARLLNAQGYVVASINYRLGWTRDQNNKCLGDTVEAKEAIYRALQDTRAAFRFITANADRFGVDTSWMFQSGSSAGGVTTLFLSAIDAQNVDVVFPGLAQTLGALDAGNQLTNRYTLKGIVDMWGVITNIDLITSKNALPTIMFHGMLDQVCPYGVSNIYTCSNFPVSYGALPIFDKLSSLGVPVVANIDPTGGHGVYDLQFRVNNIACFLKSIINGHPQSGFYKDGSGNCQ